MGEQTSSKPLASNKEQMRVPLRQRLRGYAQTWWHERGPVHAVAKLNAKVEGVAGKAVVRIVDRIVKGWGKTDIVHGRE